MGKLAASADICFFRAEWKLRSRRCDSLNSVAVGKAEKNNFEFQEAIFHLR